MDNYYVMAGMKVKSKRKAVKEFMKLVEENGFLPPGMYFKRFGQEPMKSPVKPIRVTSEKIQPRPVPVRESRSPELKTVNMPQATVVKPECRGGQTSACAPQLKPNNGIKPKRRQI